MITRIISKPTGMIDPSDIYIVQFGRPGFFGIKWISIKGFESYKRAKEFEQNLK